MKKVRSVVPMVMQRSLKIVLIIFAAMLLFTMAGCSDTGITTRQSANGDIVIGVAWPLLANDGGLSKGIELAVNEINGAGGVKGKKIRIVPKDDEASVTKGMSVAQSFAENLETVAVIGHRNSYVTIPAAAMYEKAGLVMLSPGSTAPELTEHGYRYVFRSIPSDAQIAKELVNYAAKSGYKRMVIYYVDDAYGRGLANAFEDSASGAGLNIVDRISYYGDLHGLNNLRLKWEALGYDGVFVAESVKGGAHFIADARKIGVTVPYLGGNAMDSPSLFEIAGSAADGTVVGTIFNPNEQRAKVQKFVQDYQAKFGNPPTPWAAQGYDAVKLLAAAVEKAGSSSPDQISEAMRSLQNWEGVSGYHTFDKTGDEKGKMVVLKQLRGGKLEPLGP